MRYIYDIQIVIYAEHSSEEVYSVDRPLSQSFSTVYHTFWVLFCLPCLLSESNCMRLLLKLFIQLLHSTQRIIVIYSSMYEISAIFYVTMMSNG